jgi:hypothetical protein
MLAKAKNDHANIKTTFLMNLLPEKKMGYLHEILWKKMFCAEKVTKLPDLTVCTVNSYLNYKKFLIWAWNDIWSSSMSGFNSTRRVPATSQRWSSQHFDSSRIDNNSSEDGFMNVKSRWGAWA